MFLSTTLDAGRLYERRLGPSARSLIAYMSEASLKKGPAWGVSTTLDAGRLTLVDLAAVAALINNLCHRINTGGIRGEEPLFL